MDPLFIDPIFQVIIDRQVAKGRNYTVEDLLKPPLEEAPVASILFIVAVVISCLIGVAGNSLVIGAVFMSKKLRTTGNMFIINLAIADFVVVAIVEPFNIIGVVNGAGFFIQNVWICHAVSIICVMACVCSMLNLAAIALNRYIMINKHQLYKKLFTPAKTVLICIILWCIAFFIELPNLVGWGRHTFDIKSLGCSFDRIASLSYTFFLSITALWIPLGLIFYCYLKIFLYVRHSRQQMKKRMSQTQKGAKKAKKREEHVQLARTFFIVFLSFLICWTPFDLTLFFDRGDDLPQWFYLLFLQIGHFNSSLNPILYGATNKRFRDGYKLFISRTICKPKFKKSMVIVESTEGSLSSSDNF